MNDAIQKHVVDEAWAGIHRAAVSVLQELDLIYI